MIYNLRFIIWVWFDYFVLLRFEVDVKKNNE